MICPVTCMSISVTGTMPSNMQTALSRFEKVIYEQMTYYCLLSHLSNCHHRHRFLPTQTEIDIHFLPNSKFFIGILYRRRIQWTFRFHSIQFGPHPKRGRSVEKCVRPTCIMNQFVSSCDLLLVSFCRSCFSNHFLKTICTFTTLIESSISHQPRQSIRI